MRSVATPDTIDGYAHLLGSMRELHLEFGEAADCAGEKIGLTATRRARLEDLTSDLSVLRGHAPEPQRSSPRATSDPETELGALYVLEGSALGAKVLLGIVERSLPSATPAHYLRAVVEDSSRRWPRLLAALDREHERPDRILLGAQRVFEHMLRATEDER